jgi:hypothetical protein
VYYFVIDFIIYHLIVDFCKLKGDLGFFRGFLEFNGKFPGLETQRFFSIWVPVFREPVRTGITGKTRIRRFCQNLTSNFKNPEFPFN